MGLDDIKKIMAVGVVALLVLGGAFFGLSVNKGGSSDVTLELETCDGVPEVFGAGTYAKGTYVEVNAVVYSGWIFDGWYDSDNVLITESQNFSATITEGGKLHPVTHRGYGVDLYRDTGIFRMGISDANVFTTNSGYTYEKNQYATVWVDVDPNCKFLGWYKPGSNTPVSTSTEYVIKDHTDVTLIAKTDSSRSYAGTGKITFSSDADLNLSTVSIIVSNRFTGDFISYSSGTKSCEASLVPGVYDVTIRGYLNNGKWFKSSETKTVDGDVTNYFHWYYNKQWYNLETTISTSVYNNYATMNLDGRAPSTNSERLALVDYTSTYIKGVATSLSLASASMSESERANFVLKFVQHITDYQYDYIRYTHGEHWKYPIETLFERHGDCEDTAILYSALMKAMGYKSSLLLFLGEKYIGRGHAASGIGLDKEITGSYFPFGGVNYYFCETTSDTKNVGEPSEGYDTADVLVIP